MQKFGMNIRYNTYLQICKKDNEIENIVKTTYQLQIKC